MSKQCLPFPAATALRILAATEALKVLLDFFARTPSSAMRALLLPILAERDALPAGQLLDLAIDPDDAVAVRAAEALAWVADPGEASLLFTWALQAKEHSRASALLFSAAVLGSAPAVFEARKRLLKPSMSVGYLAETLAIAGDASDADRLLDLATHPLPDLSCALLAAANLGCVTAVPAFEEFADRVPERISEEVRRMVLGTHQGSPHGNARLLRGKPWSVAGVLNQLSAPDEPLHSVNRIALELRVRTGLAPPCRLPLVAPASIREEAVARWRSHYAKADGKLAPGGWYYQGKPVPKSDKKGATC
jgi:hypothetical protein